MSLFFLPSPNSPLSRAASRSGKCVLPFGITQHTRWVERPGEAPQIVGAHGMRP
jgi:hypothetical protein